MLTLQEIQEVSRYVHPDIAVRFNYAGAFQEEVVWTIQRYGCGAIFKCGAYQFGTGELKDHVAQIKYICEELVNKFNSVIDNNLYPSLLNIDVIPTVGKDVGIRRLQDMGYYPTTKLIQCDIIDI